MTASLYKRLDALRLVNYNKHVDVNAFLDDIAMIYHLAYHVSVTDKGIFRFLVQGYGTHEALFNCFTKDSFPFSYSTMICDEYEYYIDIAKILLQLNTCV
jgi:hypothetical protein